MRGVIDILNQKLGEAFWAAGYEGSYGRATVSNRPDLCEYQCNGALSAAKQYRKAPLAIASEVAEKLLSRDDSVILKAEAATPGFINIDISPAFLADYLNKQNSDDCLGAEPIGAGQKIIIDYGGPNVAKPLHVGHLRAAIIGESLKRVYRFCGYEVIGDVHLGDWGLQMGLIIEETKLRHPELCYFDPDYTGEYPEQAPFTISDLEEIYPTASSRSKTDEAFAAAAHEATLRLQNGDPGYNALFKHIINISVADLKKNYSSLGVSFDLWKGESDVQKYIPGMLKDLKERGFIYESEGAQVIDVSEPGDAKELPPCLVQKSDGASLYATTDLATLLEREMLYRPDGVIYVVDKRQSMHFVQVFRAALKTGIVRPDTFLYFLGFGTMNGKDGKPFKTREGGVMRLETLIKEINEAVYNRILESTPDADADMARENAGIIGLAALKYADLSNQPTKDYVFDVDRFTSFEGNTGPYILYTIVRIKSIIRKYGQDKAADTLKLRPCSGASEKTLQLLLSRFSDAVTSACKEYAPNRVCQYVYEVSNAFNSFYHETKILTEADENKKEGYIALIKLTERVLSCCINLLGFEAPERM